MKKNGETDHTLKPLANRLAEYKGWMQTLAGGFAQAGQKSRKISA